MKTYLLTDEVQIIGRAGEQGGITVAVDVSDWQEEYQDGVGGIMVTRPGGNRMPLVTTISGNLMLAELPPECTDRPGRYDYTATWTLAGAIQASQVYQAIILSSEFERGVPPERWHGRTPDWAKEIYIKAEQILNSVDAALQAEQSVLDARDDAQEAQAAAETAQGAAEDAKDDAEAAKNASEEALASITQILDESQETIATMQSAADGIEAQKDTMIASIASVDGQGTDTTMTQSGVAADAKVVGDELDDLKGALGQIAQFANNLFAANDATLNVKLTQYAVTTASQTLSVTNFIPIVRGKQYNIGYPVSTERIAFYQTADTTEPAVVSNDWITGRTPSDIASIVNWFTVNNDGSCTFTVPENYIDVHNRTINYLRFTFLTADINNIYASQGEFVAKTAITAPVPYIDEKFPDTSEVLCFGDSLTMGTAGASNSYPAKLQALIGANYHVYNYGVGGETAQEIAGRQGGVPLMVQPGTFPYNTFVEADIDSWFGSNIREIFKQSGEGKNPATLAGNSVSLYFANGNTTIRNNANETLIINQPTPLIPFSATQKNKTLIIWMGTNGWGDSDINTLLNMYKCMIESNGNDNYIVIGIISGGNLETFLNNENKFIQEFGYHYIKLHDYLLHYGLADAGITPTEEDEERIVNGLVPSSLMGDSIHLNATGYNLVANQIYKRGIEIGLWN
jgi:lysophospholipase L1-like esterase